MAQNKGISALFRKSNKNVLVALSSQIILDFGKLGLQMKHDYFFSLLPPSCWEDPFSFRSNLFSNNFQHLDMFVFRRAKQILET